MSRELEDRFLCYASQVRNFCRKMEWDSINRIYLIQLIRSSSSIGANYIEASDSLGKADQVMKLKISRREAKESLYWLNMLIVIDNAGLQMERENLISETDQIRKILSTIIAKLSG